MASCYKKVKSHCSSRPDFSQRKSCIAKNHFYNETLRIAYRLLCSKFESAELNDN